MRSKYRGMWENLHLRVELTSRVFKARKQAKMSKKIMAGRFTVDSNEFNEIVVPYWQKYGVRVKKLWWEIYSERDGRLDPRYIPNDIYQRKILPYFSNVSFRRCSEDKCRYDILFPNLKKPKTIIKNIAGVFYDRDMEIITRENAKKICLHQEHEFLFKPSIDSGQGRAVEFLDPRTLKESDLEEVMRRQKANYIVQSSLRQDPVLMTLNPTSLNTIRIVTFLFDHQVHILSAILRIGAQGSRVDNVGAGGYACPIKKDGYLADKAVNQKGEWVSTSEEGIVFGEIRVTNFIKIVNIVMDEQKRLAHFKIIGWDFAIDECGDPVFIEYNVNSGQNQVTCGPIFGDLTEAVLNDVFNDRTLRFAQN